MESNYMMFIINKNMCVLLADFYNWNRVKIRYCDGASFAGDARFDNGVYALWTYSYFLSPHIISYIWFKINDLVIWDWDSGCLLSFNFK